MYKRFLRTLKPREDPKLVIFRSNTDFRDCRCQPKVSKGREAGQSTIFGDDAGLTSVSKLTFRAWCSESPCESLP